MAGVCPCIAPVYSVETSVPLSDTQTGVVGPWDRPHALTRLGSVIAACQGVGDQVHLGEPVVVPVVVAVPGLLPRCSGRLPRRRR